MKLLIDCWLRAIFLMDLECATDAMDVGSEICTFAQVWAGTNTFQIHKTKVLLISPQADTIEFYSFL
jgi:hypothetical protein